MHSAVETQQWVYNTVFSSHNIFTVLQGLFVHPIWRLSGRHSQFPLKPEGTHAMVSYLLPIGTEALISRVLRLWQFPTALLYCISIKRACHTIHCGITSLCNLSLKDGRISFFFLFKSNSWTGTKETLPHSNVNPGFDLQVALSQLKVKSHRWKVIKVLEHCFNKLILQLKVTK